MNADKYKDLSKQPIFLNSTRARRTYSGGMSIETWQGIEKPMNGNKPEEWIASVIEARNAGFEKIENEGLSTIRTDEESEISLKKLIGLAPALFLGERHYNKYGENTAVLVKLIDSLERLTIQAHPDKQFAKAVFDSNFGKTEAWYILESNNNAGEEPYLLFGFKPGVTKEVWKDFFVRQDIDGMVNCLHKIKPQPGDVYLIEGGIPHAIGPGCFLVEIQEPTDFTLRTERTTAAGNEIPDILMHQGAGFEKLFDCFHYMDLSHAETMKKWKIKAEIIRSENGGSEKVLVGKKHTKCFRMNEITVTEEFVCEADDTFSVLIILTGKGIIEWSFGRENIRTSNQLFLPASLGRFKLMNTGDKPMKILICYPPD